MQAPRPGALLHPDRLRILMVFDGEGGGRRLTAGELGAELPDVATATLYRHLTALVEAGALEVVSTRQARGTVERTYGLVADAYLYETGDMTAEEHRDKVGAVTAALMVTADRHRARVARGEATGIPALYASGVYLSAAEREQLGDEVIAVVRRYLGNGPGAGRVRWSFFTAIIPEALSAADGADERRSPR